VMFAEALRNGTSLDSVALSEKRNQVLAAVNGLARTAVKSPAVTAIVYGLWDEITPEDLQRSSRLTRNLAVAVANQWDPYNPPVERVEGLLTSPGWVNLMCTGSFEWLAAVHEGVRHLDPWLTVAMLASHGEPQRNPKIAAAVAAQLIARVLGVSIPTAEKNPGFALVMEALLTESGRKLLFDPDVPQDDRREVLLILLADAAGDKHLTRADFEHTDNVWGLRWVAEPYAARALSRFDAADLSGLSPIGKKNLIGLWLGKSSRIKLTAQDIEELVDSPAK
jgi:hypothetical protein